jgi:hypothetical protein
MNGAGTIPTDRAARTDWVAVAAELAPAFAARAGAHDADDRFVFENYAELRRRRVFSAGFCAESPPTSSSWPAAAARIGWPARVVPTKWTAAIA